MSSSRDFLCRVELQDESHANWRCAERVLVLEADDPRITLTAVTVVQGSHESAEAIDWREAFDLRFEYEIHEPIERLLLGFDVVASDGSHVFRTYDLQKVGLQTRPPGRYLSVCRLPGGLLQPGAYSVAVLLGVHRRGWICKGEESRTINLGGPREIDVHYPGVIPPAGSWSVETLAPVPAS